MPVLSLAIIRWNVIFHPGMFLLEVPQVFVLHCESSIDGSSSLGHHLQLLHYTLMSHGEPVEPFCIGFPRVSCFMPAELAATVSAVRFKEILSFPPTRLLKPFVVVSFKPRRRFLKVFSTTAKEFDCLLQCAVFMQTAAARQVDRIVLSAR